MLSKSGPFYHDNILPVHCYDTEQAEHIFIVVYTYARSLLYCLSPFLTCKFNGANCRLRENRESEDLDFSIVISNEITSTEIRDIDSGQTSYAVKESPVTFVEMFSVSGVLFYYNNITVGFLC